MRTPSAEFTPSQLSDACAFVSSLPCGCRVYVEEWRDTAWAFVFGDDRDHALERLAKLRPAAHLRVRQAFPV
jgi:hypothetical protein